MLDAYTVLIQMKNPCHIQAYYYPDFHYTYTLPETYDEARPPSVTDKLKQHIQSLHERHIAIPFPRPLVDYQQRIEIPDTFQWTVCYIDSRLTSGCWEYFLPGFGIFSSIMTAATMAILNFLTIQLSMNSDTGVGIGIWGAIYSGLMTLIIYYFSPASAFSRRTGRHFDNFFHCKHPHTIEAQQTTSLSCWSIIAIFLAKFVLTSIPIVTTTISSFSHFDQMSAMGDKLDHHHIIHKDNFQIINIIMIIFSVYSTFSFQVSFLPHLYEFVDRQFHCPCDEPLHNSPSALFGRRRYQAIEDGKSAKTDCTGDEQVAFSVNAANYGATDLSGQQA